jgi:predicted O-methyltransferase YrrM
MGISKLLGGRQSVVQDTDLVACVPQTELKPKISRGQLRILADAVSVAVSTDLSHLRERLPLQEDREWFTIWPGEHYTLLAGLAQTTSAKLAWDIGTYHGASALALAGAVESVVTNDVVPLSEMDGAYAALESDWPNVTQTVGDLSDARFYAIHEASIADADLVLVDGPKDGKFEYAVIPRLIDTMKPGSVLVMDDIRFANMRALWSGLNRPRIDLGCFGHWSGTGVVFV